MVKKAIQSAEHITTDVNWINGLDINQHEEIVLRYRATLEGLGTHFINQDLSNLSYKAQVQTFELALAAKLAKFETKKAVASTPPEVPSLKATQVTKTSIMNGQ
jgi:hypothetical protein